MESPKPVKVTAMDESEELTYEEEQLQLIIMKELETQKANAEREIIKKQNEEYQESLKVDIASEPVKEEAEQFKEVSIEEMRRVRLERFCD
tara:strand:+ start:1912 stop:2184 length:273 start_codon:yes stop_codon:yes gene_type:complete